MSSTAVVRMMEDPSRRSKRAKTGSRLEEENAALRAALQASREETKAARDGERTALEEVAALKADHPELVHTLLANHELSQIIGAGIIKDGIKVSVEFSNEKSLKKPDWFKVPMPSGENFISLKSDDDLLNSSWM